ncbi:hypothetical protein Clark_0045, partial [Mycobacterium phage Clark]
MLAALSTGSPSAKSATKCSGIHPKRTAFAPTADTKTRSPTHETG